MSKLVCFVAAVLCAALGSGLAANSGRHRVLGQQGLASSSSGHTWDHDIGKGDFNDEYGSIDPLINLKSVAQTNGSDIAPAKFITNGTYAGIREYPWLVHIDISEHDVSLGWYMTTACGGSMLSPRFVLTAAHCLDGVIPRPYTYDNIIIYLAEYDTRRFPRDCVGTTCITNVMRNPDKVIIHESRRNDIALMRLNGSVEYSDVIRPVSLPVLNIDQTFLEGAILDIAGWGRTRTDQPASPIKLKGQVKLIPSKKCKEMYSTLGEKKICSESINGQSACNGDSGGPLMVQFDNTTWLVGVMSGRYGDCGGVITYTNVYDYKEWIDEHMSTDHK